ncbi:MAG: Oxidoreductase, short-chain dehydrogenase/reductase family, partial [uncultured Acidimicrobiales bacterium]
GAQGQGRRGHRGRERHRQGARHPLRRRGGRRGGGRRPRGRPDRRHGGDDHRRWRAGHPHPLRRQRRGRGAGARGRDRRGLRARRPVLLERRHRHRRRGRGARRRLAAHLGRQPHGPRLRGPGGAPLHAGPGRRVPPQHSLGCRAPDQPRGRAVCGDEARGRGPGRVVGRHPRRRRDQGELPVPAGRGHPHAARRRRGRDRGRGRAPQRGRGRPELGAGRRCGAHACAGGRRRGGRHRGRAVLDPPPPRGRWLLRQEGGRPRSLDRRHATVPGSPAGRGL